MIINPMFFYVIGLCDDLKTVAITAAIFAVIGIGAIGLAILLDDGWILNKETRESLPRKIKSLTWVLVISAIIAVLVPTKATLIEMQIAKLTTTENVDSVVTYVLDKVEEFEEGKANE